MLLVCSGIVGVATWRRVITALPYPSTWEGARGVVRRLYV